MTITLSDQSPQTGSTRRSLKRLGGFVLALTTIWVLYVTMKVLFPTQGEMQGRSDAVVSLAPQYHRLYTATQLVDAGRTDTLVVSHFDGDVGISDSGSRPIRFL